MSLRDETQNRLCNCDCGSSMPPPPPPMPHRGPITISEFEDMLYKVAAANGYGGDRKEFEHDLGDALNNANKIKEVIIVKPSFKYFPTVGVPNTIYIDKEKNEVYYWSEDGYYRISRNSEDDQLKPDGKSIFATEDNILSIVGFSEAKVNQVATKGVDGKVVWQTLEAIQGDFYNRAEIDEKLVNVDNKINQVKQETINEVMANLPIATTEAPGMVRVDENHFSINEDAVLLLDRVNANILYQDEDDYLILDGGGV